MSKVIIYILELIGIGGLIGLMAYISWTKMALGASLSLLGAFFPELQAKEESPGQGTINAGKVKVVFRGGLRFVVVVSGMILIVGAVLDGHDSYKQKKVSVLLEKGQLEYDQLRRLSELLSQNKGAAGTVDSSSVHAAQSVVRNLEQELQKERAALHEVIKSPKQVGASSPKDSND